MRGSVDIGEAIPVHVHSHLDDAHQLQNIDDELTAYVTSVDEASGNLQVSFARPDPFVVVLIDTPSSGRQDCVARRRT